MMPNIKQLSIKAKSFQTRLARLAWDPSKYNRGKTTPGSRGGSFAPKLPPFRKGPSGVLQRVIPQGLREEVDRAALEKVNAKWLEPIPQLPDRDVLEKMADKENFGLGGRIEDVFSKQNTRLNIGGKTVAAIKFKAILSYPMEDGQTGELGDRGISDSINLSVYRDPKNSSRLRMRVYR